MHFTVHTAVDSMNQPVALPATGMHEESRRENTFAARCEDHVHRIIHAAGHYHLEPRAVGPTPKDMRGARRPSLTRWHALSLLSIASGRNLRGTPHPAFGHPLHSPRGERGRGEGWLQFAQNVIG